MAPSKRTVLAYKISAVVAGAALSWMLIYTEEKTDTLIPPATHAATKTKVEKRVEPEPVVSPEPDPEPATMIAPPEKDRQANIPRPPAKGTGKVPELLAWTGVGEAEQYGLEISQHPDFAKSTYFVVRKNRFPIEVFPGKTYHWRVKALDEKAEEISAFSPTYSFTAQPPPPLSPPAPRVPAAATEEIPGVDWYLPED